MNADHSLNLSAAQKRILLAEHLRQRSRKEHQFPASFPQQRMWFLDQLTPENTAYNVPCAARIRGQLDLGLARRSVHEIARRHEALRTIFREVDGQPVQVVTSNVEPEITVVECEHLRGPQGEAGIRAMAGEEFGRPFNLRTGPLMRIKFLRLAPDEHILLFTIHHIVGDLWSTSVFLTELVLLYGAFAAGEEATLPELKIQYPDYAVWQRKQLEGDALTADLEYWKQALAHAPAVLELPTDRPRPAVQSTRGGSCPFRLSQEVMDDVRALSQRQGVTPFMTLLAAFQVLLHRYSRAQDIVVGVPVANRGRPEIDPLIGYFANMLALRTDLSGAPTFNELLARVRETCLGGFAHQQLPFERLVEVLQPQRDVSRTPIFQVSLIFQNIPMPGLDAAGLHLEPIEVESSTSRFDLELQVFDGPVLTGKFEYNSDLFDAATIGRLSLHLELLVENLIADPDRPIGQAPMLAAEEERALRQEWNASRREWAEPVLAHLRFVRQAESDPEAEALRCGPDSLSYAELDRRSNQLAHRLKRHGVGRDVLVGICMDRSVDMVVALLGVLKAGGAFVPLDPAFPPDRIAFMLTDSQLPVLLTQRALMEQLPDVAATAWCLDEIRDELDAELTDGLEETVGLQDLAYVIYTSGSTGRPKGVEIPHRALGNLLLAMKERPGIDATDTLLAVTTLSFDIAMLELLLPLVEGARVVIATREDAVDGARLADLLVTSGATMMQATPSTWRILLDAGWPEGKNLRVLAGGEALPDGLARQLLAKGVPLWNMYGPTETTIWSAVSQVGHGPISIGEPIANTELYILDDDGQLVPQGAPGELYIGGDGLARGYLGRPELTEERFVASPFESGPGNRLYRTGDLVRRRNDGSIEFLGRLDHQVKLHGYRIELGEIESELVAQAGVKDAVAMIREDVPGDQRLVAYVVSSDEGATIESGKWPEQVDRWRHIWDTAYEAVNADVDPREDFSGWISSYTGKPIPVEEMREWADRTADRVLAARPRSVLEIGCGTGLIASRVAPHCERYWGTEISTVALGRLRAFADAQGGAAQIEFFQCGADELGQLPDQLFDAVAVNSVVQYFPDEQYLLRVIEGALGRLAPGGTLVIGDVRSLPLLVAFHTSVQLSRAEPDIPAQQLRARVSRSVDDEEELVVDPRLFTALPVQFPEITSVRVMPKRGSFGNEMTRFRYDVMLTVGGGREPGSGRSQGGPAYDWLDWAGERLTVPVLRARLTGQRPDVIALREVPNARLRPVAMIAARLAAWHGSAADLRQELAAGAGADAADPEELYRLAEQAGYLIDIGWSEHGPDGSFDLVLRRRDEDGGPLAAPLTLLPPLAAPPDQILPWDAYVNGAANRPARRLLPVLRAALREKLPDYMIPTAFVFLDKLPLTPNGKIDRQALPALDSNRRELQPAYVAPRTAVETVVAGIWAEVLDLDHVGVFDNFFTLGGHSLMSTRIVVRIREAFQVDVPLHRIFSEPTVAGLSSALLDCSDRPEVSEKTAELLIKLSDLSDDQVEQALRRSAETKGTSA
jgi:amino acid adenylation domain-containing protein